MRELVRPAAAVEGHSSLPDRELSVVSGIRGAKAAEVPVADPSQPCCAGECRLVRTDIDALRVKAVRLRQPDEATAPTAQVNDESDRGWRRRGTDVTQVNKSSRLGSVAAEVL